MAEKITVPTLGESVTEATVSKWLKSQGDKVSADEPLVELETDKVNVEVPSPINGVLGSISVKEGETVNVGSLLGTVDSSASNKVNNTKEIKDYNPPSKPKQEIQPKIFKEEKYADPSYYDYDFDYYSEEDENYKKDWTRFNWIDTEFWGDEFNSLENRFIEREKEENQKKFKKSKEIIKKKKIN